MKTKLIKLSDQHYIIVDDSEIKEGENQYYLDRHIRRIHNSNGAQYGEKQLIITHSTEPLEKVIDWRFSFPDGDKVMKLGYDKIKPLSLSEVEEAIYGYSVEKMAYQAAQKKFKLEHIPLKQINEYGGEIKSFVETYINACKAHQELVKDKLLVTKEQLLELVEKSQRAILDSSKIGTSTHTQQELIQLLLPQTEWDIEFDEQGKIKIL